MNKYEIILFWSAEDSAYIAEVPELPGCMAHGETEETALKNVKDAISLWLQTARDHNPIIATHNSSQVIAIALRKQFVHGSTPVLPGRLSNLTTFCYNMHEGKSPLGKPRAYPVSLASGKPHLVRLSLFGFGLSELGCPSRNRAWTLVTDW